MAIIDLTKLVAVHESDGSLRCMDCIGSIVDYWRQFDPPNDSQIMENDVQDEEKIYICDFCNEVLG
jgi:hypothetical protein